MSAQTETTSACAEPRTSGIEERLAALGQSDHACLIYEDPCDQLAVALPFLRQGLARGEHCVYVVGDGEAGDLEPVLAAAGIDVTRERSRGALTLLSGREFNRLNDFSPNAFAAAVRLMAGEAIASGFSGWRIAVEMTWAPATGVSPDLLIALEALANASVYPDSRITGLCQYNRNRFPPEVIHEVLRTHPLVILGEQVCPNLYYEPPELLLDGGTARKVDWMIGQLRRAQAAAEAQAELIREQAARSEAELGRQRLAFLAEASIALSASPDYETRLQNLARLSVPTLADWCAVDVIEPDGSLRQAAIAHLDPEKLAWALELRQRYPRRPEEEFGLLEVLRSGQAVIYPEVPESRIGAAARGPEHHRIMRQIGFTSSMVVPLLTGDHAAGAITFLSAESGRRFGANDLALAEQLARHASLAVENGRLYRDAQQALRARDEFLSTVSHDLRTPLTTVKGFAQFLKRQLAHVDAPEIAGIVEGLAGIDGSATRMMEMVDELLDLARLQSGQPLELERRPTDLVVLATKCAAEYQKLSDRHRIAVVAETPELRGDWDPSRLGRVLLNLLSNAVKYSPEGGEIRLEIARRQSAAREACAPAPAAHAIITVTDHGLGIPAADLPHIFDRFYRATNVAGQIPGSGIGLAGARQIVEQHGGSISAASTEGAGATITVCLPLAEEGGLRTQKGPHLTLSPQSSFLSPQ